MSESYISNHISVYKTDKKLLEFVDKLNTAPIENYACIHAKADEDQDGKKNYSNIGITMLDYTAGKGAKTITVKANILPEEAMFIFSKVQAGISEFNLSQEKIFGDADKQGFAQMTKLRLVRATKDNKGEIRKYPWCLTIENGKGIKQINSLGGAYCKKDSYQCEAQVFVSLSDMDFFTLMCRVSQYINAWEIAFGPRLLIEGRNKYRSFIQEFINQQQAAH